MAMRALVRPYTKGSFLNGRLKAVDFFIDGMNVGSAYPPKVEAFVDALKKGGFEVIDMTEEDSDTLTLPV